MVGLPHLFLHGLRRSFCALAGHWSIWVNGNWKLTFCFVGKWHNESKAISVANRAPLELLMAVETRANLAARFCLAQKIVGADANLVQT